MSQICLITHTHIAHNPRLVKEADALSAAGFSVCVVSHQTAEDIAKRDAQLMLGRQWKNNPIGETILMRAKAKGLRELARLSRSSMLAQRGFVRNYSSLLRSAAREKAKLYIAHNLEALPVAFAAARKNKSLLGFDAEDLHTGEFATSESNSPRKRMVDFVEAKYLPYCDHISAPSPQIADALGDRYGIARPVVIYNAFPWKDRQSLDGQIKDRRGEGLSLYWYSQTIGLDRGIQDAIRAAGRLNGEFEIHLRGNVCNEVKNRLLKLAVECSVAERIFFHDTVSPVELLSRATEHDVGLALEQNEKQSQALTVSNKMFLYLLAGLGVASTSVPGQRAFLEDCPGVGFPYSPGDHESLARQLQFWIDNRSQLDAAKRFSLEAARTRWNWETESLRFIEGIARLMGPEEGGELVSEKTSLYTLSEGAL